MVKIPIAIVDDKAIMRSTLAEHLDHSGKVDVLFEASDGEDFLLKMKLQPLDLLPRVVLMDIEMPVLDGIETVSIASKIYPDTSFLMLTVFDEDDKIFNAIKSGAHGYILKDDKISNIINAIQQIEEDGNVPMSPKIAHKVLGLLKTTVSQKPEVFKGNEIDYNLSQREIEILSCIVNGLNYQQTGEKLFISPNTVRKHTANIYEKLHVCNKASAIKIATEKRWF